MSDPTAEYSYIEFVHATSTSPWHIRVLTDVGKKLGGGIDTPSLCGTKYNGWDMRHDPPKPGPKPDFACGGCWIEFLNRECTHDKTIHSGGEHPRCIYCGLTNVRGQWV